MKIGFVLDDGMDRLDGVQQYVLTYGDWLSRNGNEVHYLVGQTKRKDIKNLHSLSKNIRVRFNKNELSIPFSVNKEYLKEVLNKEKFDVLHVQMPFSPFFAGKVIRLASKNTVIIGTFHIAPYSRFENIMGRLLGLITGNSIKRFNHIFSVSTVAQDFASSAMNISSTILPNAVDTLNLRRIANSQGELARAKTDDITIVFLGRLVKRKGSYELLRALDLLNHSNKLDKVKVLIGGKGPLEQKLLSYVKRNNMTTIVKFCGFISEKQKPMFLGRANIAVFPSLGGESFGIVLIEAMASGSGVVLAGDNSGYRSVMKDNSMLIDPTDTSAFAEKLYKLAISPSLRKALHDKQQTLVKQYDVNVTGRKLLKMYKETLHTKNSLR